MEAEQIAADAERCAEHYRRLPGTAGAETMIDLYHTIARLARVVAEQGNHIDSLRLKCDDYD